MDNIVSINYTTQDKKFVISINGYVLYLQYILVQTLYIPITLQILNFKIVYLHGRYTICHNGN